jgi:ketosteroid isomerase-like protein
VSANVDPDVVFYDSPELRDTGVFRGAEEVVGHVRSMTEVIGRMPFEVRSLEECGDYVLAAVVMQAEGSTSGASASVPAFHVSRWAGGRVREYRTYLDGNQAREEYQRLSTQATDRRQKWVCWRC